MGYVTIEGTWRASRLNWESWCLEVWLALFRWHTSDVDVIESRLKFHHHMPPWDLAVTVSRVKRERPDGGIEGNRAWKAFATNR
jgi:hypothetical protein